MEDHTLWLVLGEKQRSKIHVSRLQTWPRLRCMYPLRSFICICRSRCPAGGSQDSESTYNTEVEREMHVDAHFECR